MEAEDSKEEKKLKKLKKKKPCYDKKYLVAKGVSITSKKGILDGDSESEVTPDLFPSEDDFLKMVEKGYIIEAI
jgi:hypothetical protein